MDPNIVHQVHIVDESLLSTIVPFIIGFGGVVLGAVISLAGTCWITDRNRKKERKSALRNMYQAIHVEIEALWDQYYTQTGKKVEELGDGEYVGAVYSAQQEHFLAYKAHLHLLGSIEDQALLEQIVKTYTHWQLLLDTYTTNNRYLKEQADCTLRSVAPGASNLDAKMLKATSILCILFAKKVKAAHNIVKNDVQRLIELLKKHVTPLSD